MNLPGLLGEAAGRHDEAAWSRHAIELIQNDQRRSASRMKAEGAKGSLVTLICDSGERYSHTCYNDDWIAAQGFNLAPREQALDAFLDGKASLS